MTMSSRRSRSGAIRSLALQLALAAVLLLAWQGALLHPLKHHDRAGGFVHLAGSIPDPDKEGGASAQCDALAAVAACVGSAQPLSIFPAGDADRLSDSPGDGARGAPRLGYRSQAPPSLLL